MTDSLPPRTMLAFDALFAVTGLVLAEQTWVGSPRVRVAPLAAYAESAAMIAGALLITLQSAHADRWSDAAAAVFLIASTIELLWFTFGAGERHCAIAGWQMPEPVCRSALGFATLICASMAGWAVSRAVRGPSASE